MHFALTASDGTSEHPGNFSADICDLNPPPAIPVVHVSAIGLELLFSITQHKSSQGQHDVVSNPFTALALGALHRFFNTSPTPGAKMCVPRMFKSSCLAELAPGVFLPEYAHTIRPRQKLIPNLARILASLNGRQFADSGTVDQHDRETGNVEHGGWYEERFWSSMISALRMPTRASTAASALASVGGQYYGTCRPARSVLNGYKDPEEIIRVSLDSEAHTSEGREDLDWLPLLDEEELADGEMLELSSIEYSDDNAFLLDNPALDEGGFNHYSQELAADANMDPRFEVAERSQMGTSSRRSDDAEVFSNSECSGGALTHVLDQGSEGVLQDNHARRSCSVNGQHLLIHQMDSTDSREGSRLDIVDENILVVENLQSTALYSAPKAAIRKCNSEDREYVFQVNHCPVSSRELEKPCDTERICGKVVTPRHPTHHSLSEALGGDHLLRKIWERRGPAAPVRDDDMLESHIMIENDPDTTWLKREYVAAYDDPMLFDSFDLPRASIPFSEAFWLGSSADEIFEEPHKNHKLQSHSTESSTLMQDSTSTPKKAK